LPAPKAERALSAQDSISVLSAAQVPTALQIDAELGEWNAFADGKPTALTPSFVIVTATAESIMLAGRVRNLPEQGLWVRLANEVPELPPIGTYQRGGGIMPLQCDVPEGENMYQPFDNDTCRSMLEQYDELQNAYASNFVRQLHITAQAVSVRKGDQEAPLANAKHAYKSANDAVTFEVALPLSALPRISTPELSSLYFNVERGGSAPPGEPKPEELDVVTFATPLRFGLDSEMLGCLMQNGNGMMPMSARISYQPGVPNQISLTKNSGGFSIAMGDVPLSTRQGGLGPLEVRSVYGGSTFVAVLKEGQLVACSDLGDVLGVVERGKGLHVIGFNVGIEEAVGAPYGYYSVLEIEKDGTLHEDLLQVPEESFLYSSVGGDHAKNLATFSVSGTYQANDGGSQQHQLLWRYDARTNHYALKQRKGRYVPPANSEPTYSE
jgi:hypothetical protein